MTGTRLLHRSYTLVRETPLYKGYSAHCTVRFMFTLSEDELHRRGTRSTLLLQHKLAFSIVFMLLTGELDISMGTGLKLSPPSCARLCVCRSVACRVAAHQAIR